MRLAILGTGRMGRARAGASRAEQRRVAIAEVT